MAQADFQVKLANRWAMSFNWPLARPNLQPSTAISPRSPCVHQHCCPTSPLKGDHRHQQCCMRQNAEATGMCSTKWQRMYSKSICLSNGEQVNVIFSDIGVGKTDMPHPCARSQQAQKGTLTGQSKLHSIPFITSLSSATPGHEQIPRFESLICKLLCWLT